MITIPLVIYVMGLRFHRQAWCSATDGWTALQRLTPPSPTPFPVQISTTQVGLKRKGFVFAFLRNIVSAKKF